MNKLGVVSCFYATDHLKLMSKPGQSHSRRHILFWSFFFIIWICVQNYHLGLMLMHFDYILWFLEAQLCTQWPLEFYCFFVNPGEFIKIYIIFMKPQDTLCYTLTLGPPSLLINMESLSSSVQIIVKSGKANVCIRSNRLTKLTPLLLYISMLTTTKLMNSNANVSFISRRLPWRNATSKL